MKIEDMITQFGLVVANKEPINKDIEVEHGYSCDLLSQVLASAKSNSIWITIQSHLNIIGVATMADIKAIVICENHEFPDEVIKKADEEHIVLLKTEQN